MKNSNLAERLEEFIEALNGIEPSQPKPPRILAAVVNTEKAPRPRPVPARRRIQSRDQDLRAFRVF